MRCATSDFNPSLPIHAWQHCFRREYSQFSACEIMSRRLATVDLSGWTHQPHEQFLDLRLGSLESGDSKQYFSDSPLF